ncbi:MAG: nucleotidyltransferase [Alphaproteobacteria bacterium CG_4_10_14_0_2_um_filter_63_37]|nr:MAG: nucleotidyltransferase [Alphaproteobacteria bacterium CG_4_10_14_0_2_um_filter_63_37]
MDVDRLYERIAEYLKAVDQLEKAVLQPKDEFIRDSVIQRFEFTHELAWKMLKLRLEQESIDAKSPKQVLQEALQVGWIWDGNAWSELQRMRNLTSHTYDETLAEQVYGYVTTSGLPLFKQLAEIARVWGAPA